MRDDPLPAVAVLSDLNRGRPRPRPDTPNERHRPTLRALVSARNPPPPRPTPQVSSPPPPDRAPHVLTQVGRCGKTAAITLVERTTRFLSLLALPAGKAADGVCDVLIDHVHGLPDLVRKSLTWDQGTEMGRHAALTMATDLPVYFAHPHSPWERPTNDNTNGLIRRYLPKGSDIPQHQPYLTAIAEELNNCPRKCLDFLTPQEAFQRLLHDSVASTP